MGVIEQILEELQKIDQRLDRIEAAQSNHQSQSVFDKEAVAEFLSVSEGTVYKLWNNGRLAYIKIGRRKVSTIDQLQQYIEENSRKEFRNNVKSIKSI